MSHFCNALASTCTVLLKLRRIINEINEYTFQLTLEAIYDIVILCSQK